MDTFDKLARELNATTKRLAPALAKWDDEDDAAEHMAEELADTLSKILERSNRLARDGVIGFTPFTTYARLEKYIRTQDRQQRGARSGPARTLWEGSWAGNDAERARTLCVFLQKLEKSAPPRSGRPKGITKRATATELEQRNDSIQRAFEELVREGNRTTRDPLYQRARTLHAQRYGKSSRLPTKGDVAKHPCWQQQTKVRSELDLAIEDGQANLNIDQQRRKKSTFFRLARQLGYQGDHDEEKMKSWVREDRNRAARLISLMNAAGLAPLKTVGFAEAKRKPAKAE
jgi:hypothetical protein